ncbi:divergent PAP2 family protein [Candidatus Woesearchaeota archaeon]|nr:divergent PAP2 family protein [Candidatus Woesearchaeota archaeon]
MIQKLIMGIALSWIVGRVIKSIIDFKKEKRFVCQGFFRDGGMPSLHTAFVVATATGLYLETRVSYLFILSVVLALIVMNDAMKVRWITGEQSKAINQLMAKKKGYAKLEERVGHTPAEVFVGLIIGVLVPYLVYSLL